ncbi:hypothetical protein ACFQ44_05755 [Levilactobacillus lanxiensis]|uniref:Uncharacterized protein n=1 Tax=Levilactobacillus lanxiensis TaxID=2799568 RepID=A0ABW4D3P9_9LACO|nr:hypothetical protein [Levilactobacillus lanxiensis]
MKDSRDSDYMTFYEYLNRLRKDLNAPDFSAMEGKAPDSEEEYLNNLKILKQIFKENE